MKKAALFLIFASLLLSSAIAQSRSTVQEASGPDYSKLNNWAASPFKSDTSDSIPKFLKNEIRNQRADVFFIHPTSFFAEGDNAAWNAGLSDAVTNQETDFRSILFQATVFNGSCRVFAPRYRQANMKAFYVLGTPVAKEAFDLAYSDVRKAFLYFLDNYNENRPIIIASHSQGSLHAIRLLQEFFDGTPLQKRLVCAYIVGYQIKIDAFKNIPVGASADQTGCFVGWRSYVKGEIPQKIKAENGNSVCVNPLTWTTSVQWASPELHQGVMNGFETIIPHTAGAGIEPATRILWVDIQETIEENAEKPKNLHIYDYNLFWMNIRQNVKQRINAYYKTDYTSLVDPFIGTGGHGHTFPGATVPFGMVQISPDTRWENWDGPDIDQQQIPASALFHLEERMTDYVNPFIGTDEDGHTFPGALVPFGMVQLSPDNGDHGYNWCSGYHYSSKYITGFSHTHFSGTGSEDLCDISVFPLVNTETSPNSVRSEFSHEEETAKPGYYSVLLKTFNIRAELTATLHCGLHRYTFPESKKPVIKFDLGFGNGIEARVGHNGNLPLECYIKKIDNNTVVGFRRSIGFAGERCVYFAAQTSKPFNDMVIYADSTRVNSKQEARAVRVSSYLSFPATKNGEQVLVKVAISSANIEGAMAGLQEIKDWDFETVKKHAEDAWEDELGKIKVTSGNRAFKETFYTSVYHCCFAPFRFDDALGKYTGADKKIHEGKDIYTLSSLWDTYRATAPLFTITQTGRLPVIINSYLEFYKQYGLLPSWELYFNEANVMPGYHAVPIIADAILKDIEGFDYNFALEAMKETANQEIRESDVYRKYGYVPDDLDPRQRGVTKTVEYAFDDWCIAQVAKKMNRRSEFDEFMKRSEYWKNVFDSTTGFVRPKNSKGNWILPFNPKESIGFQEGNAWIYTWYVPQDVYGLVHAMGGADLFAQRLDSLYNAPDAPYRDIKNHGFYGLSEFSNEPSHHVPYLYSYVGKPWQTAERVNHILTQFYSNQPNGLCGNDDCGQMSAWYVFSSIGFYPVNPANGEYVFGSPLAEKSELTLSNGRRFVVRAENLSKQNIYIQKATLNGIPYTKSFIKHSDIMKGGELVLFMGRKPSETWGTKVEEMPGKLIINK